MTVTADVAAVSGRLANAILSVSIRDCEVHIYATLGAEGNETISGHLHRATATTFFVNAYVVAPST